MARFATREDLTMFLLTFADPDPDSGDVPAQKELLRRRFGGSGWECPSILDALDRADDLYFDRVSQIRLDTWSRGRVALVGDAAYCVSLPAGQGSALGMAGAYILDGELRRAASELRCSFCALPGDFRTVHSRKTRGGTAFCRSIRAEIRVQTTAA